MTIKERLNIMQGTALKRMVFKPVFGFYLAVLLAVLALDLITKFMVTHHMELYESIPLIGDILKLTYVRNTGAAFSLLAGFDSPLRLALFITVKSLAAIIVTVLALVEQHKGYRYVLPLALVGGGALGNLYDRITVGTVVDFIEFSYRSFHFPVFNVADSAVCVGVGLLIIFSFSEQSKAKKNTET